MKITLLHTRAVPYSDRDDDKTEVSATVIQSQSHKCFANRKLCHTPRIKQNSLRLRFSNLVHKSNRIDFLVKSQIINETGFDRYANNQ